MVQNNSLCLRRCSLFPDHGSFQLETLLGHYHHELVSDAHLRHWPRMLMVTSSVVRTWGQSKFLFVLLLETLLCALSSFRR